MVTMKDARKEGGRTNFTKSEPDKLYIDRKYVKSFVISAYSCVG